MIPTGEQGLLYDAAPKSVNPRNHESEVVHKNRGFVGAYKDWRAWRTEQEITS